MENRVHILKEEIKIEITIKALYDANKQKMLLVWIVLFSLCGLVILTQFFKESTTETKVFFCVYLAFWLFFQYKVIYAYRWRKYGEEKIIIQNNQLLLMKTIGKRGFTQAYEKDKINKIDFYEDAASDFIKSINTSYWNINKYSLVLSFKDKLIPFAIDLEKKDAKKILNELRKF